jgi:hypothetical protein
LTRILFSSHSTSLRSISLSEKQIDITHNTTQHSNVRLQGGNEAFKADNLTFGMARSGP